MIINSLFFLKNNTFHILPFIVVLLVVERHRPCVKAAVNSASVTSLSLFFRLMALKDAACHVTEKEQKAKSSILKTLSYHKTRLTFMSRTRKSLSVKKKKKTFPHSKGKHLRSNLKRLLLQKSSEHLSIHQHCGIRCTNRFKLTSAFSVIHLYYFIPLLGYSLLFLALFFLLSACVRSVASAK